MPAELFMLVLSHKCCEISEGVTIQSTLKSTSGIKIIIATLKDIASFVLP